MYRYYTKSPRYLSPEDIAGITAIYGTATGIPLIVGSNNICNPSSPVVYSIPLAHSALDITWTVSNTSVTIAPSANQVTER